MMLEDTRNATSSPGLAGGQSLSPSPVGQQLDLFGRDHAPISPFRWQGLEKALKMKGTYGLSSHASSVSANLQRSLESRLRQNLGDSGSLEYVLTWKRWDMESGPPICALRASVPRNWLKYLTSLPETLSGEAKLKLVLPTSDSGCGGWPTPKTPTGGPESAERKQELGRTKSGGGDLQSVALVAGWRTPTATDGTNGGPNARDSSGGMHLSGQAGVAGWKTPAAQEPGITVDRLVTKDGKPWIPGERAYDKETGRLVQVGLTQMAQVVGWGTPRVTTGKYCYSRGDKSSVVLTLDGQAEISGTTPSSSHAPTKRGVLNPDLPRWLMGYPEEHLSCGVTAMR